MAKKPLFPALLLSLILIADGLGCGWSRADGIRYNGNRSIDNFAFMPRPKTEPLFIEKHHHYSDPYSYNDGDYYNEESEEQKTEAPKPEASDKAYREAQALEENGNYAEAAAKYREAYLNNEFSDDPKRANSVLDRIDLLASSAAKNPEALKKYLRARNLYDSATFDAAGEHLQEILSNKNFGQLHDNARFLLGAAAYFKEDYTEAVKRFGAMQTAYPASEKLGAAHFMKAKAYYHLGEDYNAFADNEPKEKKILHLKYLKNAAAECGKAIKLDPDGLLAPEYYGWQGGAYWKADMPLESLAAFANAYRLERRNPGRWLQEISYAYGLIRANQEEKALEIVSADPKLLLSYVWYGIYHHAGDDKRQLKLARGAQKYLQQRPETEFAPSLTIRIAQSLYSGKMYAEAADIASKAVSDPTVADQALWMRGVSNSKLKKFAEAESDLRKLIKDYPNSTLAQGAIEELGIVYEFAGKPEDAVALYLEKRYLADARYIMDIILTVDQVEALSKRKEISERDEVFYALGSKYMLDMKLAEARAAFNKIESKPAEPKDGQNHDVGTEKERILEVIGELEALLDADKKATTDEERAASLYAVGAYIYRKNNQNGGRHAIFNNVMIQSYDSPYYAWNTIYPDEEARRKKRFDRANLMLRAEEYFVKVAANYPKSASAPKALYSAALTRLWLIGYHPYYSYSAGDNFTDDSIKKAKGYFRNLMSRYPKDPLAKDAEKALANIENGVN